LQRICAFFVCAFRRTFFQKGAKNKQFAQILDTSAHFWFYLSSFVAPILEKIGSFAVFFKRTQKNILAPRRVYQLCIKSSGVSPSSAQRHQRRRQQQMRCRLK